MELKDLRKAAVSKPQISKLKMLGEGMKVGVVLGNRILVKPVIPYTDADRVEKVGLLVVPQAVKEANTPLPSTGVVVQLGLGLHIESREGTTYYNYGEHLQPGTGVCFSKYGGTQFVFDQEDFIILNVEEIMCTFILEEEGVIEPVGRE